MLCACTHVRASEGWVQIHVDSDSREVDLDPDLDLRCPDSHITGTGRSFFGVSLDRDNLPLIGGQH